MDYSSLLKEWGLSFKAVLPEISLCGSPERCAHRLAVKTQSGKVYVLEKAFPHTLERKKKIAKVVNTLHERGVKRIHPYLLSDDGAFLVEHDGDYWQIMPYVDGVDLPRPAFATDEWRGEAFAGFLLDLRAFSNGLADDSFSIPSYVIELKKAIQKYRGDRFNRYERFFQFLEKEFSGLSLTLGFCHGDLHPINAIWGKNEIKSVIDWEFFGNKPELYDVANLVGCVGIEDPAFLLSGMVPAFVKSLQKGDFGEEQSWKHFPELMIAVRAGWLSEWFRKKDEEMLDLEATYIDLLIEKREQLRTFFLGLSL